MQFVIFILILALYCSTTYSYRFYGSKHIGIQNLLVRNRSPLIILAATADDIVQTNVGSDKRTWHKVIVPALTTFLSALLLQFNGGIIAGAAVGDAAVSPASAVPVYFGVGCFWHVQHEFVVAEQKILSRSSNQLTSAAGYAGGSKVFKSGGKANDIVCYHNLQGLGDYGRLGYGEVVQVTLPSADPTTYRQFSEEYFSLFGPDNERPDKGDMGPEYRSLVGIPGGLGGGSPLAEQLKQAAAVKGISLIEGRGDDADTLGRKMVWVMDSEKFPFRQAEIYHQFHDGFMPGEQYPESYNSLVEAAYRSGAIKSTGCPDRAPPAL